MALTITVSTPLGSPAPRTHGGEECVEVGSQVNLTAKGGSGGSGSFHWSEDSGGTLLSSPSDPTQVAWAVTGRAFGLVTIKVTATVNGTSEVETLKLYVGSVVIVGADGRNCQVFSDGSVNADVKVDSRVNSIVDCNAIVADLTDMAASAEAVTCYVLNLKSFVPDNNKTKR
jgi:hypothetical protein